VIADAPTLDVRREEGALASLYRRSAVPAGPAWGRLAIIHGYGDHSGRYEEPMLWWAARGLACHAIDLRGHGRAAGRRGAVSRWEEYLDDVRAFFAWLTEAAGPPLFLLGHSHGGLVAAAAVEEELAPPLSGCILSAPFLRSNIHVSLPKILFARAADRLAPHLHVHSGVRSEWMSRDSQQVRETRQDPLVFRSATPRWYFTTQEAQRRVLAGAPRLRTPLLLLLAEADRVADPAGARAFFAAAGSPDKTLRAYAQGRHEVLRETDRVAVFGETLAWMRARVPEVG
jgi:lysophospholipase